MICFSRFGQDKKSRREIQKGNKASAAQLKKDYKAKFFDIYGVQLTDSQFCFIDNNIDEDSEDEEKKFFSAAVKQIDDFSKLMKPFFCHDIKEVMKENDELRNKLQNLEQEFQKKLDALQKE